MSTTTTPTPVDRTVPKELLDLARLALLHEFDGVHLTFESLGADFPAPIGWLLHLVRVSPELVGEADQDGRRRNSVIVSARIGQAPQALVAADAPYWDVEEIREWILAETPAGPASTERERDQAAADADLMIEAWKRGWSAERTVDRSMAMLMKKRTGRDGRLFEKFVFDAPNRAANVPGHNQYCMSRIRQTGEWIHVRDNDKQYSNVSRVSAEEAADDVLRRVHATPPRHTEVAYFDDDLQEWVL
jgi:hypothetical protein